MRAVAAGRWPRLAYARINQESNAFSPLATTLRDFERTHLVEGAALERTTRPLASEVPGVTPWGELSGFCHALRKEDVELVPLLSAWAMPSGPLTEETFAVLRDRLLASLRDAGPLDGVYLCLHGSMRATGVTDPEGALIEAVRAEIGDRPLAVSYDLHGLMTKTKAEVPDLVTAYRTNPHRDLPQVGMRTARLLLRAVRGEICPRTAWRSLPMALGGGLTIDFLQPMRRIFRRMKAMEKDPRVLSPSLFMVHPFTDAAQLGWSTVVVTDDDAELAERLADELAELAWSVRDVPPPALDGPREAIDRARRARWARRTGCVFFTDVSDVVGAGGVGDNPNLLRALLDEAPDMTSYVPIRDPIAVAELWEAVGQTARATVGAAFTPEHGDPVEVQGRVLARREGAQYGRGVAMDLGPVKLVITEEAPYTLYPSFYGDYGLRLRHADIVVVKSFFHFRIFHGPWLRRHLGVKTRGTTDLDLYAGVTHDGPIHPRDPVDDWRPRDRVRRQSAPMD